MKEGVLSRRVVAASAAHIAVLMRGRVQIQLRNGVVTAKLVAGPAAHVSICLDAPFQYCCT